MTDLPASGLAVLPPRPNPGPEPYPGPPTGWTWVWPAGLGLAVVLVSALVVFRARSRRRSRVSGAPAGTPSFPASDDPGATLLRLASEAREALARRFGPAWRSRTTEEVAADPGLAETLGPETADRLVGLLRAADALKFADAAQGDPGEWAAWVAAFAGASSRINGK